jgi:hypothetical protein
MLDIIDIVLGLLLFALGLWLNRKQEKIVARLDALQEALAKLELREKITVIKSRAKKFQLEPLKHGKDEVRLLIGDCTAGLSLFEFAPHDLRCEYIESVYDAWQSLDEEFMVKGKEFQSVLADNLAKHGASISKKEKPEIAAEYEALIAKCTNKLIQRV